MSETQTAAPQTIRCPAGTDTIPEVATATPLAETPAETLLAVRDIEFSYGPLQVLFGVSLDVPVGGRVALLGTNGAGKSTLLRVIAGLQIPQRGTVHLRGQDITRLPSERRVRLGMTLVEGGRAVFPSIDVRDNLRMGAYTLPAKCPKIDDRMEKALGLFPQLRPRLSQKTGTLSGGEQQMVALARAIVAAPELLLIDEVSLGLAPVVMADIVRAIEELVRLGTTVLIVEQSLNVAVMIAEHAFFMEKGEVRFSGRAVELFQRGDLVRSVFFGSETADT
jgi:ABC-type branched-subunit amino acid transport system ATPase component